MKVLDKDNLLVRDPTGSKHCWFVSPQTLKVNKLVLFSGDIMAAIASKVFYLLAVRDKLILIFNRENFHLVKAINTK